MASVRAAEASTTHPRPSRLATIAAAAVTAIALAGCSQMGNPAYDLNATGCTGVGDATLAAIQQRVHADGTLRNGKQVTRADRRFISAELHLRSDRRHDKGDILTWATSGARDFDFRAVDVKARENSSWPVADVDIRAAGGRESRACVTPDLGKTSEQIKCEQDRASSTGPKSSGGQSCADL